jgi:hypothetical protein
MTAGPGSRRQVRRWAGLCAAAILFTIAVGLWQAQAIQRFRHPPVDRTLTIGERAVVDGVAYQLTSLTHATELPVREISKVTRPSGVVSALAGAELVLVVLTVEVVDPARDPETVYCEVTLQDAGRRSWRTDGTVEHVVAKPEAPTCSGSWEQPARLGTPFEVGLVYQVPADVTDELRVMARLSGGEGRYLLEFRPR